ncbi:MBL fold metallo-hydrolase [Nocardia cyriacigeorgica]|uniref:MBL fold metallo-hydrolase n=3 Tax=Nocardia cyriacigeorgica TaxID=135487 RepID=A0A6P1DF44_9NOCA|nr:MBL fold metallo-hydrolase [Nocardia cyriacigeorgica]NEW42441.1 MBL fold metallo-hydrolase [Nocardia cyriacigeorgica]NEW47794.1 MBL fold metallo-hydrolase [Nocardia cyriacigeorgica]NEW52592.1 MBL fold metallo-hydrolase [Nocardia cyriacigeorgica]NEW59231.1 MBL fold metallo-hydrolase [Nocardia cyriacigeorgica]
MDTHTDEIADGIYRISTFIPDVGPAGFTFNQFFVDAEEPLLFHCGMRALFPLVSGQIERIRPVEQLRWITFGHVEADECGAMNQFLAAAPNAQVAHGELGCMVSIDDMADRPPRRMVDGEVIDLGGRRVQHFDTPHAPHNWEARVLYEQTTGTLFCGDLMSQLGKGPALTAADLVGPASAAEDAFHATSLGPAVPAALYRLADLQPTTLAIMHGSSFVGDSATALRELAADYEQRLAA